MNYTVEHYKDHYRITWEDGSTTEVDTLQEVDEEVKEREEA